MTFTASQSRFGAPSALAQTTSAIGPRASRSIYWGGVLIAFAAGFLVTGQARSAQALSDAGAELTHLLRAMAAIKAMIALAAAAGVHWRLGAPAKPGRLIAYLIAGAVMAVGPGLIWDMREVALGALTLHAGLIITVVLLWRDPVAAGRLSAMVAARRAEIRSRRASF